MLEEIYYYLDILSEIDKEKVKEIDMKAYTQKVFALAKRCLKIKDAELTYEQLEEETLGKSDNKKTIIINKNLLTLSRIHDLTQTIFHESRHLYQSKYNKIEIDFNMRPTIPLIFSDETLFYLTDILTSTQCYNLYFTSLTEKDARDYANKMCETLYDYLQQNIASPYAQKLLDILKTANKRSIELEKEKYKKSMFDLNYDMKEIAQKTKGEVNKVIAQANEDIQYLKEHISYDDDSIIHTKIAHIRFSFLILNLKLCALVSVYCDESMKNAIKNFCLNNVDIEEILDAYISVHNYHNWNATTSDINQLFTVVNEKKIPFDDVCLWLPNFDQNELAQRYANVIKRKMYDKQSKMQEFAKNKENDKKY